MEKTCEFCEYESVKMDMYPCSRCIKNAPTENKFQPKSKSMQWIKISDNGWGLSVRCPRCNAHFTFGSFKRTPKRYRWKCCPICMTKMDGVKEK